MPETSFRSATSTSSRARSAALAKRGAPVGPGRLEGVAHDFGRCGWHDRAVEIVLRSETPDGVEVVLYAIVYAKIVEEHPTVADLDLIDRTVRQPEARRPDPRPGRERFSGKKPVAGCLRLSNSERHLQLS